MSSAGFSGGRTLPEDVERVVGDTAAAHVPGCYALVCDHPDSMDALERRWSATWDVPMEEFARAAFDAPTVVYVGASGNVYRRLDDHVNGDKRRSGFLRLFPPHHVLDVYPMDDPFTHEGRVAYQVRADLPDAYVYSDAIR